MTHRLTRITRLSLIAALLSFAVSLVAQQRTNQEPTQLDSDHDGLSDALEQQLLEQFAPTFMIAAHDCSNRPAEFKQDSLTPSVEAENGTIYGQVFPARKAAGGPASVEIHYYHLWRIDCGGHGHPLDTEHVAVLVLPPARPAPGGDVTAKWKAIYWYAAAHEDTVCDVSQITRAKTIDAEDHGATAWLSPGKHASFLSEALCQGGCGGDRCVEMKPLHIASIVNLGEPGRPMNGSVFIASKAWPLTAKMTTSNFPVAALARVDSIPGDDIAWFNPGRHPAQGVIATSYGTGLALAGATSSTGTALSKASGGTGSALTTAGASTGEALSRTNQSTGNALQKSFRNIGHALGVSAKDVGKAFTAPTNKSDKTPQ